MINKIKQYISSDRVSFIHIEELLTRDHTIIYASDHGFIIRDNKVNFIYISFSDFNEMKDILSKYKFDSYLAYEKEIVDFYGDTGNTTNLTEWMYPSKEKYDLSNYDIRKLGLEYLDIVNSKYKAIGPGENNKDAILNDELIGIFEDNKLAGFIGRHPEGCTGMLLVFEEYRGKGYGFVLERAKINDLIDRNIIPFGEVVEGNEASTRLQEKLGMIKGEKTIYWKL